MNLNEFLENFEKNAPNPGYVDQNNLINQRMWKVKQVRHLLPDEWINKYKLLDNFIVAIEGVPAGATLPLHKDLASRRSNLLRNITGKPVKLMHTNNETTEEVTIQHGETFLLNTSKPHGAVNTDDYDYMFFSLGFHTWSYDKVMEYLNGQV